LAGETCGGVFFDDGAGRLYELAASTCGEWTCRGACCRAGRSDAADWLSRTAVRTRGVRQADVATDWREHAWRGEGPHYDGALDEDTWVAISGYGPTKATVI